MFLLFLSYLLVVNKKNCIKCDQNEENCPKLPRFWNLSILEPDTATVSHLNLVTFNKFWLGFQQFGHIFVVFILLACINKKNCIKCDQK